MNNICVTIGTNYDKIEPICNVQRYSYVAKQKASVVQPELLNTYHMSMEGVDKRDWLTSKYANSIRLRIDIGHFFKRDLDMFDVDAWTMYKPRHGEKAKIKCLLE